MRCGLTPASHQNQHLLPDQLGHPSAYHEAGQADAAREARRDPEEAHHGTRPEEREGGSDPQAHRLEGMMDKFAMALRGGGVEE
jgi:hypothetical protein